MVGWGMGIVFLLIAIAVIVVAALMLTGRWSPALGEGTDPRGPGMIDGQERFDVVMRGYRMDQVDQAIAELQARVRELEK
jgi:DivIVA domain-containing protein